MERKSLKYFQLQMKWCSFDDISLHEAFLLQSKGEVSPQIIAISNISKRLTVDLLTLHAVE